jgi:predicted secreted hydrolase
VAESFEFPLQHWQNRFDHQMTPPDRWQRLDCGFPARPLRALVLVLIVSLGLSTQEHAASTEGSPAVSFLSAGPGYQYGFPRDHGSHDRFRTEWWYYTGHLSASGGRRFGFQLTFFRRGMDQPAVHSNPSRWSIRHLYLAHFAVTDIGAGRYHYAEKISRAGLGKAGAEPGSLQVWIDRWIAEATADSEQHHLRADTGQFGLDLTLSPLKPPVIHGEQGVSRKGSAPSDASHYYSLTRLATEGVLRIGSESLPVTGTTWMDHEFGSGDLAKNLVGWDWFSVQLDDRRELMLYLLRQSDGRPHPASSGTLVLENGQTRHLPLSAFSVEILDHWTSPHSRARYPSRWRLLVPSADLDLELSPYLADQELRTERSTQVTYWEGAVALHSRSPGRPITGQGYVELTGYSKPFRQ